MIFNEDFLKGIPDHDVKDVDLVLTSPPYFDARNYGGVPLFSSIVEWEHWCIRSILRLAGTVKESGVVWWNTGSGYADGHKLTNIYRVVANLETLFGIYLIDEIPWIKKSAPPKNLKNRPYPAWEHNYIFSKHPDKVIYYRDNVRRPYAPATLSRMKYSVNKLSPNLDGDYIGGKMVSPNPGGASAPNYLILPQDTSKRPHPAPMTPELANWAIRAYTKEGDIVLDPMMGVGTTMIESIKLNRKFIGFELFKEYIDIAEMSLRRLQENQDPYNGLRTEWEKIQNG